jgi:hypothetical protein
MKSDDSRFLEATDRFQVAHLEDPRQVAVGQTQIPWSLFYHQRLLHWVHLLSPTASEELQLAASCQHIRRWTIPRDQYPPGKSGYKRWRKRLAGFHADQAAEILGEIGYDSTAIARVQSLLQKFRLKLDPEVQILEDAICLVFLENEFSEFAGKHDRNKVEEILQKTWLKMSSAGRKVAQEVVAKLAREDRDIVEAALLGAPS